MTKTRPPTGLLAALNAEWGRLVEDRTDAVARWAAPEPTLAGCRHLDDVLERGRQQPDAVLWMLLARCAAGDQLAGRAVLQAMLGKLVRMARVDPQAGLDDYVAALWIRIRTYPLTQRPRRVAANLALDTLKSVRRETRHGRGAAVTPYPPEVFVTGMHGTGPAATPEGELSAARLIATAARLGLVKPQVEAVLTSVYAEGLSGRDAALRHGTTAEMIRYHCSTAVRRLARHADALAEAA